MPILKIKSWCAREDLNLHPLRDQILSLACLPFHHSRNPELPSTWPCLKDLNCAAPFYAASRSEQRSNQGDKHKTDSGRSISECFRFTQAACPMSLAAQRKILCAVGGRGSRNGNERGALGSAGRQFSRPSASGIATAANEARRKCAAGAQADAETF